MRLGRRRIVGTLAYLGRKSHHATPAEPYNPHSRGTEPRGFVQQGLSALTRLRAPPIIVAVRMKPYSLGGQARIEFMALVFVTKAREPDPEETDNQHPHAHIAFGGVYFFLYPAILRLRDQTGELIDPQTDAFFDGATLDELERFVSESRHGVLAEPHVWEQRVGASLPIGEPRHERTSQAAVLELLDQVDRAIVLARKRRAGVFFMGE